MGQLGLKLQDSNRLKKDVEILSLALMLLAELHYNVMIHGILILAGLYFLNFRFNTFESK